MIARATVLVCAGVTPVCEITDAGADTLRGLVEGGVLSTEVKDWTGNTEPFTDPNGNIGGGCRSQDARGAEWICFTGQKAETEKLISADVLGVAGDRRSVG